VPRLRNILPRFKSVRPYANLAYGWRDRPALAVLGVARQRPFSSADLLSRIGHRFFPTLVVRPKQLQGNSVILDPADGGHVTVFDEVFVSNVYNLSLVPFVPEMIVDCGGHIGLFSALAASRFPDARVVIFEPVPANLSLIDLLLSRNRFRVEVIRAAVGTSHSTATFHLSSSSCAGSLEGDLVPTTHQFEVRVADLRQMLKDWQPSTLLLKVDIEGAEETLIPAVVDVLPTTCALFFETHRDDKGWDCVYGALTKAGFIAQMLRSHDNCRDGFALRSASGEAPRR